MEQMSASAFEAFTDGLEYPMYVVTVARERPAGGERVGSEPLGSERSGSSEPADRSGCLVGFGSQVSLDPPRFMVCISVENHTHPFAVASSMLAVHLLGPDQHALAELFGGETGDEIDKFAQCAWTAGPGGVPILDGCPRVLVGRVWQSVPLGDHTGFVLDPVDVVVGDRAPGLTFHDVEDVDPGHPA